MHHDPLLSSKKMKLVSWGHVWVVVTLVIRLPAWAPTKIFSLPIGFRLYRNRQGNRKGKNKDQDTRSRRPRKRRKKQTKKQSQPVASAEPHRTRPELGLEILCLIAKTFANRVFVVTGDSLYGGESVLSHLPANVHCISRVHANGVLYTPAPAPTGKQGRRRKKGERLSSMQAWADDSTP